MKLLWDFAYVPKGSYMWELHLLFCLFICNVPLSGSLCYHFFKGQTFSLPREEEMTEYKDLLYWSTSTYLSLHAEWYSITVLSADKIYLMQWRIRGGGGQGWSPPPPLELVLILKTYAKCAWPGPITPPPPLGMLMTSQGQCPRGWWCLWMSKRGCLSIFRRVDDVTQAMPIFRRVDDVTQAMSKGRALWMFSSPPPPPLQEILYPRLLMESLSLFFTK